MKSEDQKNKSNAENQWSENETDTPENQNEYPSGIQEDASLEEFLDLGDIFEAGFIDTPIEELVAIQPDSIGNWVRTSLLKELHEPGIFETRNRIYVMLNADRRKSVSPSYIDGRPSIVRSLKSYPRINKALINIEYMKTSIRAQVENPFKVIKCRFCFTKAR